MRLLWARVTSVDAEREGLQRLRVLADGEDSERRAYCLTRLTGSCATAERVLLNVTATDLALGTGGWDFVLARDAFEDPSGGHVMKLRYTPLQRDVLAVEEEANPHADVLADVSSVPDLTVVACPLHSHVPVVAGAIKAIAPGARVAYVMTDAAALPLALSDTVAACMDAGLVDETITCGQAFGGMYEAVNLHSGLAAAAHVARAEIAIVAIGPGVTGTGTRLGHGGVAQGEALNAAVSLSARAVASLRVSEADARERHRGLSHHSATALGLVALGRVGVAVPADPPGWLERALEEAGIAGRHELLTASEFATRLPDTRGVGPRSMGRTPEDDPAFFLAAAWAGEVAARGLG